MVVSESDMREENDDNSQQQQEKQSNGFSISSPIGRQSSIYSLTLDEFQHHTLSGKNFGSMNMDEFLNSIWTAEENQNQNQITNNNSNLSLSPLYGETEAISARSGHDLDPKGLIKQPSLLRQGSLTLPPPLSSKTVDEVWSEIHGQPQGKQNRTINVETVNSAPEKQPTFGEMTLEDFLVKAGVVKEQSITPPPPASVPQQYGVYPTGRIPTAMFSGADPAGGRGGKRNGDFGEQHGCYTARMWNVGGYGVPVHESIRSPGSSDGIEISGLRGRKRVADGPVEKVVERRQKRMIKNRESAARSRARKQAYTVELEAELNQLREENGNLKQSLADLVMSRKKQEHLEEVQTRPQTKARKAEEKLRKMRRALSCPL